MTCSTSLSGKNRIVLIAGILMIATTLRVTFTGAAPLLDTIRSAYSLTTAQGVSNNCKLPGGETIDEWALWRRDHPAGEK